MMYGGEQVTPSKRGKGNRASETSRTNTSATHGIIIDPAAAKKLDQSKEQEHIQQMYRCRELCHMMRDIEQLLQEVGDTGTVYLHQVAAKFPALQHYCKDHHFHDVDGTEHIVIDTVAFMEEPDLMGSLLKDCHFKIITFARQGTSQMSARDRATQLMGKIKGIDAADAMAVLDPEQARKFVDKGQGGIEYD